MTHKKKIGILTLRVDNNYGGHLQRYALSQVLKLMGHEPIILYFRSTWQKDSLKRKTKLILKNIFKALIGREHDPVLYWKYEDKQWEELRSYVFPFFEKYISHTELICSESDLYRVINQIQCDAYIVGSDQVWRKAYTERWGVEHFFLDFTPNETKKIAYAASFGLPEMEYNNVEIEKLRRLYQQLDAVSVREDSGLDILDRHGWTKPQAELVLDPTMLLPKEHYIELIRNGNTSPSQGNLFCYILDESDDNKALIKNIAIEKKLQPFCVSICGDKRMSVEQWLRSYLDAEYVVTDSYHGVVFSLIFNKPFYLILNQKRGSARFESLMRMFAIVTGDNTHINWNNVNSRVEEMREKSINYIISNLQ